jgi:hypothetical protein
MCAAGLALAIAAGILLAGCASTSIERLSGPEFMEQAKVGELSGFHWTSYVGSSPGRAYLEAGQPAFVGKGTRTTVYWTYLSELPADFATNLKADDQPRK